MKITWVEILLRLAITLIPISLILRLVYGSQWIAWEYDLVASWGINRMTYDAIKILILLGVATCFVVRDQKKRKKERAGFYELPDSK